MRDYVEVHVCGERRIINCHLIKWVETDKNYQTIIHFNCEGPDRQMVIDESYDQMMNLLRR